MFSIALPTLPGGVSAIEERSRLASDGVVAAEGRKTFPRT
jgi:hypothetical protein